MATKKKKKTTVIYRDLSDIRTHKMGVVDKGANGRVFVIKSEGLEMKLDPTQLAEAAGLMNQVVNVTKSGTPTAAAAEALVGKLLKVDAILKNLGVSPGTSSEELTNALKGISDKAKAVASASSDLTVADQIDSLISDIADVQTQLAPTAETVAATDTGADAGTDAGAAGSDPAPAAADPAPAGSIPAANTPPAAEPPVATDPPPAQEPPGATGDAAASDGAAASTTPGASAPAASAATPVETDKAIINGVLAAVRTEMAAFKTEVTKMLVGAGRPLSEGLDTQAATVVTELPSVGSPLTGDGWDALPEDFNAGSLDD